MKNIAFTICSNNYLSQAKVLSDSVYEYSKDNYDFIIVLCDVYNSRIDYSQFHAKFILAKDLEIANFNWMTKYYNIIELNTAIKPFAFKYIFDKYSPEYLHYLDPDTCTYYSLNIIEEELGNDSDILLTPHSLAPLPYDGEKPTDNIFLNNGIYNLGFLGTRKSTETDRMLDWWCNSLEEHCLIDTTNGFFVDQLPMELVPLFFEKVKVCRNKGLNVAYWNLHEREVRFHCTGNCYSVCGGPLVFFHFSNYKVTSPNRIASYYSRSTLEENTPLKRLFTEYRAKLLSTDINIYKSVNCVYTKHHDVWWRKISRGITNRLSVFTREIANYVSRL